MMTTAVNGYKWKEADDYKCVFSQTETISNISINDITDRIILHPG